MASVPPFRLAAVLKWQERERDAHRQRLAEIVNEEELLRAELERWVKRIEQLQVRQREVLQAGPLPVSSLLDHQRYEESLRRELARLRQQQDALTLAHERCQQELQESDRQVRTLENLRDRQAQQWQTALQRREQATADDLAGQRHFVRRAA